MCKVLAKKAIKKTVSIAIFSLTPLASPNDATFKKLVSHNEMPIDVKIAALDILVNKFSNAKNPRFFSDIAVRPIEVIKT